MVSRFNLNPMQEEAVTHVEGPLLILAGAGSGKTRVLVERMVYLVQEMYAYPHQILAVTFTNKAAQEMKHRMEQSLGRSVRDLWISTFHSTCLRILRRHAPELGYTTSFVIYDDQDQLTLIKKIASEMNLSDTVYKPKTIQASIDKAKNEGLLPHEFPTEGDYYLSKVAEVYTRYQEQLKVNGAMDFGDLILQTLTLFRQHPAILQHYQETFKFIMVDEYQDTNVSQYQLIRLLASYHNNLCVVGDDDQSIYKFRGAEIRNILDFQKDFAGAKIIRLEQNYRSTQVILDAANAVIGNNKARMGKKLWTDNGNGELIKVATCSDEKEEARFVSQSIKNYLREATLKDIAIFYRTNAQSRAIEDELRRERLGYKIFGGMKFYDRMEVKDIMAYLRLIVNPQDDIALKRVINVPARGIGKTSVEKLESLATQHRISLWQTLESDDYLAQSDLNAGAKKRLQEFTHVLRKLTKATQDVELEEFLPLVYEQTGYWQMLEQEKTIESQSRMENLREFVNVVSDYVALDETPTLSGFLDQSSLASDLDKADDSQNYITLMTIHLAKGLEFPYVFLVGLEEGLFPHSRSLDDPKDLEEERRLLYVGITRAKKALHISFASERRLFGTPQYNFPSRFLKELPADLLDVVEKKSSQAMGSFTTSRPQSSYGNHSGRSAYGQNTGFRQGATTRSSLPQPARVSPQERTIDVDYSQTDVPLRKGARVRHAVFGDGNILGFEGRADQLKVTIRFASGIEKKLLYKHAHLTVLG